MSAPPQQHQPPKLGGLSLDPEAIMAAVGMNSQQRETAKNQSCCCKALTGLICLLCCPLTCPLACCAVCCGACCAAGAAKKAGGGRVGEDPAGAITTQPGRFQAGGPEAGNNGAIGWTTTNGNSGAE